jgi:hypothetical protein
MITLKDSIEIDASIDRLLDWFMNIDKNFTKWNPNHKKFEMITGGNDVGDIVYFEQCVNGIWYKVKARIIRKEVSKGSFEVVVKSTIGLGTISFSAEAIENGCRFTHVEEFGMKNSMLGKIVNYLVFKILARKQANWDSILQDMKEDNVNLKEILERRSPNKRTVSS